jgi:hypothetical protein
MLNQQWNRFRSSDRLVMRWLGEVVSSSDVAIYQQRITGSSVADPDFYPSRIPDPKTATKERGEKKLDVKPFYLATKFNKIVNYFSFEVLKKKIWANFQRIIKLFTKKLSKSSSKYGLGIRDPGSNAF